MGHRAPPHVEVVAAEELEGVGGRLKPTHLTVSKPVTNATVADGCSRLMWVRCHLTLITVSWLTTTP